MQPMLPFNGGHDEEERSGVLRWPVMRGARSGSCCPMRAGPRGAPRPGRWIRARAGALQSA